MNCFIKIRTVMYLDEKCQPCIMNTQFHYLWNNRLSRIFCDTLILFPLYAFLCLLPATAEIKKLLALHSKFSFMCSGFLPYPSTREDCRYWQSAHKSCFGWTVKQYSTKQGEIVYFLQLEPSPHMALVCSELVQKLISGVETSSFLRNCEYNNLFGQWSQLKTSFIKFIIFKWTIRPKNIFIVSLLFMYY